jgi:type IVB pilus formation R64 PilN family outer membrane protein
MLRTFKVSILAVVVVSLLAGCSTVGAVKDAKEDTQRITDTSQRKLDAMSDSVRKPINDYFVGQPFVAGNSIELSRDVTLPPAFRTGVNTQLTFKGASSVDLLQAAQMISQAIGVPVRVMPDALLPASTFSPKAGQAMAQAVVKQDLPTTLGTPTPLGGGSAIPGLLPGAGGGGMPQAEIMMPQSSAGGRSGVMVNVAVGAMPAAEMLDFVTAQIGAYWKFEKNAVEIYRLVTRTFEISAQAGKTSVMSGLGRTGAGGGQQSFESQSQTKIEQANLDILQDIKTAVDAMLTRGGAITVGNGSIVVTDTKASVERVAEYVTGVNKQLTRRIKLLFEAIDVNDRDNSEFGVDWNIVFSRMGQMSNGGVVQTMLNSRGPSTLTSDSAGQMSAVLSGNSRFNGSQLLLKALSDVGTVANHTKLPMVTLNRKPVQYAMRRTFDYVASVQVSTVASSAGTTTAPAITQKEETVGLVLTVTPSAYQDGRILMNVAYDNTQLTALKPYKSGSDANSAEVQQRIIDGGGLLQTISMRTGQTILISGIDKFSREFDEQKLDKDAPVILNGSNRTKKSRTTTVLLITAVAEDDV